MCPALPQYTRNILGDHYQPQDKPICAQRQLVDMHTAEHSYRGLSLPRREHPGHQGKAGAGQRVVES